MNLTYKLPSPLVRSVQTDLEEWKSSGKVRRLWQQDASLWTNDDEAKWLGWLDIVGQQIARQDELIALAADVKKAGFTDILLLGMGGSSLCPEVLDKTYGHISGFPRMHVLDSTDPAQVKSFDNKINPATTLFIVSSKSGSTLEPNIFKQYFYERTIQAVGEEKAGLHFIAITDPGSKMEQVAKAGNFRHIFHGVPSIGGRYSALSDFGMIPAAAIGLDIKRFLSSTDKMVQECHKEVQENSAAILGVILGTAAKAGRDKVTIIASPGISDLGAWLEQLLAESTGKQGHGIIPVDREALGTPAVYGNDRVFAYVRLESKPDLAQDAAVAAIEGAGHPVIRIALQDVYDLGQEFFRWEFATAVAGSVIGINAFNQPDVEASKNVTRDLTSAYEKTGSLPAEQPIFEGDGVKLFTDPKNAEALKPSEKSLIGYLKAHFNRITDGDYFALLGYVQMNPEHEVQLQAMRHALRDNKRVATCLGFGPRFLHSTGQAYKGGPNSGVFLQVTCDDAADLAVPDQKYTFGIVKAAQARGDFQVLADRGRRALRVHLGPDIDAGLSKLQEAFRQSLS